jgi:hypothetical protein
MASSGMLQRVALVRTDDSEERSASFIIVTRIGELGTTLAITSNRRTLRSNTKCLLLVRLTLFLVHRLLSLWWWRRQVPPKRRFLQEPQGATSQTTVFFMIHALISPDFYSILNFIYLWNVQTYSYSPSVGLKSIRNIEKQKLSQLRGTKKICVETKIVNSFL